MKTKTTNKKPAGKATPFTFKIRIDEGRADSRKAWRELSYPKTPDSWTSMDLLKVIRLMVRRAFAVRKRKPGGSKLWVTFNALDGGTEVSVSQDMGVWACLPGRTGIRIPHSAIAGLVSVAETCNTTHLSLPNVVRPDPARVIKDERRLLAFLERVRTGAQDRLEAAEGSR